MKDIKAVYFDMGGVLMDINSEYSREAAVHRSLASPIVRDYLGADFDFQGYFTRITSDIDSRYRSSENFIQDDAWFITKSTIEAFMKKPVPHEVTRRIFWDYIEFMTSCFRLRPETPEVLGFIRDKGYILGLISNVFHPSIVYKQMFSLWKIDAFFNPLIFSSDLIFKKPDPRIFQYALSFHPELKAEQCLFIGDTYKIDIRGARSVGMVPIWMNNRGEDENPWDVTEIRSLLDLKNLI